MLSGKVQPNLFAGGFQLRAIALGNRLQAARELPGLHLPPAQIPATRLRRLGTGALAPAQDLPVDRIGRRRQGPVDSDIQSG